MRHRGAAQTRNVGPPGLILVCLVLFLVLASIPVGADTHGGPDEIDDDLDGLIAAIDSPEFRVLTADDSIGVTIIDHDATSRYIATFDEDGALIEVSAVGDEPVALEVTAHQDTLDSIAASSDPHTVGHIAVQSGAIDVDATSPRSHIVLGIGTVAGDADAIYRYATRADAERRSITIDLPPEGDTTLEGHMIPIEDAAYQLVWVHHGEDTRIVNSSTVDVDESLDDPATDPLDLWYTDHDIANDLLITVDIPSTLDRAAVTVYAIDETTGEDEVIAAFDTVIDAGVEAPIGEALRLGAVPVLALLIPIGIVIGTRRYRRENVEDDLTSAAKGRSQKDGIEGASGVGETGASIEVTEDLASITEKGQSTSRDPMIGSPLSADSSSERLRSVPAPPPGVNDPCEERREEWADMVAEANQAAADAERAMAEAQAAQEAAEQAAEAAAEAEEQYDDAEADLASAEETTSSLETQLDDAREAVDQAREEKVAKEEAHASARDKVTRAQRRYRRLKNQGASMFFVLAERRDIYDFKQERDELLDEYNESREAYEEARAEFEALQEEHRAAEEALEESRETYEQADADAEAAKEEAEAAKAEADTAELVAEDAKAKAEALLDEAKEFAEEYAECLENALDALAELAADARRRAEEARRRAEEARRRANGKASDGRDAATDAYPDGDPKRAAEGHLGEGRRAVDEAEREAREAEDAADEAERLAELAEKVAEFLEELRGSGLPGAGDIPRGTRTRGQTRRNARRARGRASSARQHADRAREIFGICEPGATRNEREITTTYYELDNSRSVEFEFDAAAVPGALVNTKRGQAAERAQRGMSNWLQLMADILEADQEALIKRFVDTLVSNAMEEMEFDDPEEMEETKEELASAINKMLQSQDVEIKQLGGSVGLPAEWFAALLSAGATILDPDEFLSELKDRAREIPYGTLRIWVPVQETEEVFLDMEVCVSGIWIRVREKVREETYPDHEYNKIDSVADNEVLEKVQGYIEHVKRHAGR